MNFISSLVYLAQSSPAAKSFDPIAFANQLLNSVGIIGILLLTGLGLAITFGVMRIINLAHGEFIMLGAYTTFVLQSNFKMDLLLTIPFAFIVTAAIGALVELTIIRRLYGRPLETLLATWGLSIVLQGVVKLIFTAQLKYVKAPPYIKGNLSIFKGDGQSVEISYYRLFIFFVAVSLLALTAFLLYRTPLGRQIRAVTQNRDMTRCLGVNTSLVDMVTFAYGCGLAGIAGSVIASLKSVAPPMGQDYLVDAWMTVVTGGVDKLIGVLAGSVLIGSANSAIAYLLNDPIARVIVLFSVIVLIRYRPEGLFTVQKRG